MTDADGRSFEELLAELDRLTKQMASGDVGIEEATELYEQAVRLHELASARLRRIEERIAALGGEDPPVAAGS